MPSATREIYHHILNHILDGRLDVGDQLPTENELAKQFRTSRTNARAAVRTFESQGVVSRNKRQGTIVRQRPPAPLARHLKSIYARQIHTMITPDYFPTFHWNRGALEQMETVASAAGYAVVQEEFPAKLTRHSLEAALQRIADQGSSALILMPDQKQAAFCLEHAEIIYQYHRNICVFNHGDTPPKRWPFHVFTLDPFGEGAMVGEYVVACGLRQVCFAVRDDMASFFWAAERYRGLRYGLRRASNATVEAAMWQWGATDELSALCRRLQRAPSPMAVVAANDEMAVWLLDAARALGLRPPRDFSLVAFDNNPALRRYNLTTMATPVEHIGRLMAEFVCDGSSHQANGTTHLVRIASRLVERETCRRPVERAVTHVRTSRTTKKN